MAEQFFAKNGEALDKSNAQVRIMNNFTMDSFAYAESGKTHKRRTKCFMNVFHGENFGHIFNLTRKITADKLEKLQNSQQGSKLTVNLTSEVSETVSHLVLSLIFSKTVMDMEKFSLVTQWKNGKEKPTAISQAFHEVYAKSHQKLSSLSRHLLMGDNIERDIGSEEKENTRNKLEIRDWFLTKLHELQALRERRQVDLDTEYISYADALLADSAIKEDEEAIVTECLSLYQNMALPSAASILSGLYYIMRDPKIKQTVMKESEQYFGQGLNAV